eukprot:2201142-Pyramimonas_sp.AAC.1
MVHVPGCAPMCIRSLYLVHSECLILGCCALWVSCWVLQAASSLWGLLGTWAPRPWSPRALSVDSEPP